MTNLDLVATRIMDIVCGNTIGALPRLAVCDYIEPNVLEGLSWNHYHAVPTINVL